MAVARMGENKRAWLDSKIFMKYRNPLAVVEAKARSFKS